ncbi:MAG: alpha-mannosidase [Lentisphaerae bacterium]|nr:alpha-mannosidase [Lentisphaerota bacterium]
MFKEEINIYQTRCEKFLSRISSDRFSVEIPLEVEVGWSKNPVAFKDREKLSYRPIKEGEKWGEAWENAYFKLSGIVPDDWQLEECILNLNFSGEALVFTPEGVPFYSLTGGSVFDPWYYKSSFPLPAEWVTDRKFTVWVEAASIHIGGVVFNWDPPRNAKGLSGAYTSDLKAARLSRQNDDVWHLQMEFYTLFELYNSFPESHYRRKQLLAVLNAAIDAYHDNPGNAAAARAVLAKELTRPAVSSAAQVTAIGHAHIDIGWLWPVRESIRKVARTFSSQLYLMERYPDYVFGASQPQLYQFAKDNFPEMYEKIRKRVAEGRWECQGGMWAEADCNVISGESMVRQFLHGKNFFMDEFGVDVKNLWLPDVFGYSVALPQIIRKAGCDYFLTQKISWNQVNHFPHHSFRWVGLDGTEVLTHFLPENDYNAYCSAKQSKDAQDLYHEIVEAPVFMSLFGMGDGGGGPSEDYVEKAKLIENLEGCPKRHFGTAKDFFAELNHYKDNLPTWTGELYLEMHRGTLTSQARTKKGNRQLEQLLVTTEFLASCGKLENYPQQELDKIWKVLLLNQFHDILPGSSIRGVYEVTEREHAEGIAACRKMIEQAMQNITSIDGDAVAVANTLPYEWHDRVALPLEWAEFEILDQNGNAMPRQIAEDKFEVFGNLKAGELATWRKGKAIGRPGSTAGADAVLENELVRYSFNSNGELISVFDKENGREFLAAGQVGNRFSIYIDRPNVYDAWDIDPYYPNECCGNAQLKYRSAVEVGEVESFFTQELAVGEGSVLNQRISLRRGSCRLDFATHANWQETHRMLRVEFQIPAFTDNAAFEIQYGYIKRPTYVNTSWDAAKFEVVGHRWADRSNDDGGAALLNDCKYGYCHLRNGLDLALLRSPVCPDFTADRGEHDFTYSFLPHQEALSASPVMMEAAGLNRAVTVVPGRAFNVAAAPVTAEGDLRIEVLKKAEKENALVLRLVEAKGKNSSGKLIFSQKPSRVVETNLMEWTEENIVEVSDLKAAITMKPFEIRTLKIYF